MEEIWKNIDGFIGYYQVSNFGRVKSLDRQVDHGKSTQWVKEKILVPQKYTGGYLQVLLKAHGIYKVGKIHRLVATAFLPNPDNKPQVNHINSVRDDNRLENLEWCTRSENNIHSFLHNNRKSPSAMKGKFGHDHHASKAVVLYTESGELIKEFGSVREAERVTNIPKGIIYRRCNNKNIQVGENIWKYKKDII